jgi:hypothetical protein
MCSFLHSPFTSFLLGPNILLSILFAHLCIGYSQLSYSLDASKLIQLRTRVAVCGVELCPVACPGSICMYTHVRKKSQSCVCKTIEGCVVLKVTCLAFIMRTVCSLQMKKRNNVLVSTMLLVKNLWTNWSSRLMLSSVLLDRILVSVLLSRNPGSVPVCKTLVSVILFELSALI